MLTRDEAKTITDRVLSLSRADEALVTVTAGSASNLRFARNSPSTSGSHEQITLTISSSLGTRTGATTINQLDDDALAAAVRRSEDMARLLPEDAEHMPVLAAQTYAEVSAYSDATARRGAEAMARGVGVCLQQARDAGVIAAGFAETAAEVSAIASSRGLFGYHRATSAYLAETARTQDGSGSGWASAVSHRIEDIDFGAVSQTAIAKASASMAPRDIEPGAYVTILEPACVANLMGLLVSSMDARRADEGRSYFSAAEGKNRRGETLFGDSVSIYSDPRDPAAPGMPWGEGGVPQTRRHWIERGRVQSLITDRFWAQETGVEPVAPPSNLIMAGGSGTVDDLVASTERGLLVTSLWYIRSLDPRTVLFTGITRDGVFWIEDGKIAHPVRNLRWNDSPVAVLKNLEAMSAAVRVPPRPTRLTTCVVPAIKVKSFSFSSVSDAV